MTDLLKIDFVSDVACPWCAIGLGGLETALEDLQGEIAAEITFHPFELNPDMPPGGENALEHVAAKYRISPAQVRENRQHNGPGAHLHLCFIRTRTGARCWFNASMPVARNMASTSTSTTIPTASSR